MADPAGAVAGRIYAFRDVSAEQSVERMKSDFVSTVSQELRSPLTSIYGFAETLLRRTSTSARTSGRRSCATSPRGVAPRCDRRPAALGRPGGHGAISIQLAEIDVAEVVNQAGCGGRRERRPRTAPVVVARRGTARGRGRR